jgi:hypothetical protein
MMICDEQEAKLQGYVPKPELGKEGKCRWQKLGEGSAALTGFLRPKRLRKK